MSQVLDQYIPGWAEKFKNNGHDVFIVDPPCMANGTAHEGVANPDTGAFCIDKGRVKPLFGGSADERFRFVVIHEFMHVATPKLYAHADFKAETDHAWWAPQLGVQTSTFVQIQTQKPTPSGVDELVADCLAESITGLRTEEYWQTWVNKTNCGDHPPAAATTQRMKQALGL